jgi:hypothetical protein
VNARGLGTALALARAGVGAALLVRPALAEARVRAAVPIARVIYLEPDLDHTAAGAT